MSSKIDLLGLNHHEMDQLLAGWDYSSYHSDLLWRGLYRQRAGRLADINSLRSSFLDKLENHTTLQWPEIVKSVTSADGQTLKLLVALVDGQTIETVVMHFKGRTTICVSTQVGCAMNCVFCATGQMGFVRHLTSGEIVAQVLLASGSIGHNLAARNIVFMGMGEPLHNFDNTVKAIDILTDDRGLALAPKHVTVSTIGLPSAIRKFAELDKPVKMAVSLHAANDRERSELVPVNRRWPLDELLEACRDYQMKTKRRIFFEWALIKGQNDDPNSAHSLGRLLANFDAHVNLIPLNPTADFDGIAAESESALMFQKILGEYGLPNTVRQRKGIDIKAGCGQLKASQSTEVYP